MLIITFLGSTYVFVVTNGLLLKIRKLFTANDEETFLQDFPDILKCSLQDFWKILQKYIFDNTIFFHYNE